jgi:putative addiction module killer protein
MLEVLETAAYANWFKGLRDRAAKARIDIRVRRLSLGNPGDVRPVGQGVSEPRIQFGPGYRIYFIQNGEEFILLLAGGDKSSQAQNIKQAQNLAQNL